jgi:S-DNA-T family DNA segregation ATPase FtsK/SpoIIIE
VLLGLVDRPDRQDQQVLALDLEEAGTWLAVGGPRSGRTTLLRTVLRQAAAHRGADRLHVHVVDLGGGALAAEAAGLPQAGTVVGSPDALRIVRLVDRLTEEVASRRRHGATGDAPSLLLLVDGVDNLCTLLDDSDPGGGSTSLLRLLRDGAAAGLTGVLTGDRAVPGGRLAAVARHRLVLPLADRADYAVAGIALSAVPTSRPPGRALLDEQAAECQLVLPPTTPAPPPAAGGGSPLRVVELPPDPVLVPSADRRAAATALQATVGPGGDEGNLLAVDLLRTGGLLVTGPAGSGRSTAIEALVGDLVGAGVPVLDLRADPTDTDAVAGWLAAREGRPGVVCVDDLGSPAEAPALALLPTPGAPSGVVLVAGGHGSQVATWFQGPVASLRRARSGLLLTPVPGDAEVLGLRLPRTPVPRRPGSGWLILDGGPVRVQVARRSPRTEAVLR